MNNKSLLEPTGGNILIVDDNPENLRFLSSVLEKEGYQVRNALDAELALDTLKTNLPDLILLDVGLPDMDGFELCQRLKATKRYKEIPVIFLSARVESVDKVKGFQVGGIDYITKPFALQEVLARVKTHMTIRFIQKTLEVQNTQLEQEIVARQQFDEELKKYQEHLEERVAERTAELELANKQLLEEINERKQAEEKLQLERERSKRIITSTPAIIC